MKALSLFLAILQSPMSFTVLAWENDRSPPITFAAGLKRKSVEGCYLNNEKSSTKASSE